MGRHSLRSCWRACPGPYGFQKGDRGARIGIDVHQQRTTRRVWNRPLLLRRCQGSTHRDRAGNAILPRSTERMRAAVRVRNATDGGHHVLRGAEQRAAAPSATDSTVSLASNRCWRSSTRPRSVRDGPSKLGPYVNGARRRPRLHGTRSNARRTTRGRVGCPPGVQRSARRDLTTLDLPHGTGVNDRFRGSEPLIRARSGH